MRDIAHTRQRCSDKLGVKQGDSGQRSGPVGLINYFVVENVCR